MNSIREVGVLSWFLAASLQATPLIEAAHEDDLDHATFSRLSKW